MPVGWMCDEGSFTTTTSPSVTVSAGGTDETAALDSREVLGGGLVEIRSKSSGKASRRSVRSIALDILLDLAFVSITSRTIDSKLGSPSAGLRDFRFSPSFCRSFSASGFIW